MFAFQNLNDNFSWYHAGQVNAPQIIDNNDSNGQLLQVLDAVLSNGFNSQMPIEVVAKDEQVVFKFGTEHGFLKRSLISVSGAVDSKLNGNHRVIDVVGNDVVIHVGGTVNPNGDIVVKVAPLGWENMFGSDDKLRRAYRSKNPNSTRTVLFLDMGYPENHGYHPTHPAKRAMVSACEDMKVLGQPINAYTDENTLYWHQYRSYSKNDIMQETDSAKNWVVFGNKDYFFVLLDWLPNNNERNARGVFGFGDFSTPKKEAYNMFIVANHVVNDDAYLSTTTILRNNDFGLFSLRRFSGQGSIQRCNISMLDFIFSKHGLVYPQDNGFGVVAEPLQVIEGGSYLRGFVPRFLLLLNNFSENLDLTQHDDILLVRIGYYNDSAHAYLGIYLGD